MRILFDNDVPWPLRKHLTRHEVFSAYHCGWHQKTNGELLDLAEADGFEAVDQMTVGSYRELAIPVLRPKA